MGRNAATAPSIRPETVRAYLRRTGYPDAEIDTLAPLGEDTGGGIKSYGYGRPLRVQFRSGGRSHDLVIRTMSPDPFGHDRRADRADAMLLSFDTFNSIPRHIHAVDVGAFADDGSLVSIPRGEVFLVTDYVEGRLYAKDLLALQKQEQAGDVDLERATALAHYLAALHAEKADPARYARHLRDTIGSGEGIFGLCDVGYQGHPEVASPARLEKLEQAAVSWRWRLGEHAERACRTHGDFHPFNILFRDGSDFSVLDCSRGAAGEAADDVTCLAVNYLFFALSGQPRFDGALRQLWHRFWQTYLDATHDLQLVEVVAPYFAWRALVVASPIWYPQLGAPVRQRLLGFAEALLAGAVFHPDRVDELLT